MERVNNSPMFTQQKEDPESLLFSLQEMMVPGTKVVLIGYGEKWIFRPKKYVPKKDAPVGVDE